MPRPSERVQRAIDEHPFVVMIVAVFAVVSFLIGAASATTAYINWEIDNQMRDAKTSLADLVNSRSDAQVLYGVENGQRSGGSVSAVVDALRNGRRVYVRYTREGATISEVYRACDDFSLDTFEGEQVLTCFMLRIPDTTPTMSGRSFTSEDIFEDLLITTNGDMQQRKYRMVDGMMDMLPSNPSRTSAIWWLAPPKPVVEE